MNRRHFFQSLLLTPLLGSLLVNPKQSKHKSHLYMITDSPQDFLWIILQSLERYHFIDEKSFSFLGPSPCERPIQRSLHRRGWKHLPGSERAFAFLSSRSLIHPAAHSFTFIKGGNILDIRHLGLDSLWKNMRKHSRSSSLMTMVSLGTTRPSLPLGQWASVYADGKHLDSIPLKNNVIKTYHTKVGQVIVSVKGGKASVFESSCLHKVCCLSAATSCAGEHIICAPNHFLLKIDRSHHVDTSIG